MILGEKMDQQQAKLLQLIKNGETSFSAQSLFPDEGEFEGLSKFQSIFNSLLELESLGYITAHFHRESRTGNRWGDNVYQVKLTDFAKD
jgi:hypothetical protein